MKHADIPTAKRMYYLLKGNSQESSVRGLEDWADMIIDECAKYIEDKDLQGKILNIKNEVVRGKNEGQRIIDSIIINDNNILNYGEHERVFK